MIPDAVGHNGYSSSASYWYGAGHAPMATLLATSEYCLQAHVSKFERMSIGSVALQVDHVRVNLTGNNPREVSRASGQGRDSGLSKRSRSGDRLSGPGALQAASTSTRGHSGTSWLASWLRAPTTPLAPKGRDYGLAGSRLKATSARHRHAKPGFLTDARAALFAPSFLIHRWRSRRQSPSSEKRCPTRAARSQWANILRAPRPGPSPRGLPVETAGRAQEHFR